jgi:dihydroflavonol-4-reductase
VRALVTGATGLLGGNLARALVASGWEVRATTRDGSKLAAIEDLPVERVHAELEDRASLDRAVAGCEVVIHAAGAGWVGRTGADVLRRVNVDGTDAICRASGEAGVRRFVHVSSVDALGIRTAAEPADDETAPNLAWLGCAYIDTKREAEEVVLRHRGAGLDAVIVNPGYMLGPWDVRPTSGRMLLAIARGGVLAAPGGGNCFVDVRDVVAGIEAAISRGKPGRRYVLGGENLSYFDAWRRFARILGVRGPLFTAPRFGSWLAGAAGRAWTAIGGREPEINPITARLGELPHYFSSARARSELGYPETDLDRAVADASQWFRDHGYN